MQRAHFNNIRSQITSLLSDAKIEIEIAMAWFTSAELFSAIISCLSRGVSIKLVLLESPINFMEYAPDFNDFIKSGGTLYIATSELGFMHHKFCVIDGKTVISGSYNWTYYAETRNVENVFITDEPSVVNSYQEEFNRLCKLIEYPSQAAPRYSMIEIEAFENIDFNELNTEIENICRIQNRPVKKMFETRTEVVVSETKLCPIAKEAIGIYVNDGNGIRVETFIKSESKLPNTTKKVFYFDSKSDTECSCKIVRVDANSSDNIHLIKEEDILRIAQGTNEANLPIEFSMTMDDNGSLRVDVYCEKSGKRITISTLDKALVKYV